MEHLHHFGLTQDPFQNEPDLRFYFDSASHRDAQCRVERGLRQNKGLTLLTGDSGSGKTLVTRRIFDGLEEELFEVTLMVMLPGAADPAAVLNRYARQVGVEEPASERSALLGQVYEQLAMVREEGRTALLIVDDAHVLQREAIAEIGGLLNLEYEERRLLSMLWVGTPELDVLLSHNPGIGQRVDVRAVLHPLDPQNATAYVWHRVQTAGGIPNIIPEGPMSALFKYSRGRPRLINTIADNALFEAYLSGRKQLEVADVERAASELGIGLDPGNTYSQLPPSPLPETESDPVIGQLTDPNSAGPLAIDPVNPSDSMSAGSSGSGLSPGDSAVDIGTLFESAAPEADDLGQMFGTGDSGAATQDLDAGVEEVLGSASSAVVDLDAEIGSLDEATRIALPEEEELGQASVTEPGLGDAEATRIAFADEELSPVDEEFLSPAASPVQDDGVDEIDDLFVELIDD